MSKAEAGIKLVRWLPQIAEATARDIARFGPQAVRVRGLLDFLPTMSEDAARISDDAANVADDAARYAARDASSEGTRYDAVRAAWSAVRDALNDFARYDARGAAYDAALGESASDLIDPRTYRTLTNPLATGRAFDIVQRRGAPENFLDIVRGLGDRRLVTQPIDVLGARTLARASDPEREAMMEVINAIAGDTGYADTGYESLAELIDAARRIG